MPTFTIETISVTEVCPGDTVLAGGVPEKITRIAEIDATANNVLMMGKSTRVRLYSKKDLIAEVPLSTTVCRLVEDVVCVPEGDIKTVVEERAPVVPVEEGLLLNLNKALLDSDDDQQGLERAAEELVDSVSEELGLVDEASTVEVPRAIISMLRDNYYRAQHDSDYPTGSLLCAVAVVLGMVKEKAEKTEEAGEA
jgi:hypothetical protein